MKPLSIFIVEDEIMYACLLQYSLSTKIVGNISLFDSYKEMKPFIEDNPDFILLDYHLEHENGLTIQKLVKEASPRTNIIFVSGTQDKTIKQKALEEGAFDFIQKDDLTFEKLENIIKKYSSTL